MKHQFICCLNHSTKPNFVPEHCHDAMNQQSRNGRVKRYVIYKIFHFLFSEAEDSATVNKTKQNVHILKENRLIQQEQI